MKKIYLTGLTGMILSAVFLLNEGNASRLTTPPQIQSIGVKDTHSIMIGSKTVRKENSPVSPSFMSTHHLIDPTQESENEEKPNKKKFGWAILFLGVMAEKS
jgi:hypothetical protein